VAHHALLLIAAAVLLLLQIAVACVPLVVYRAAGECSSFEYMMQRSSGAICRSGACQQGTYIRLQRLITHASSRVFEIARARVGPAKMVASTRA